MIYRHSLKHLLLPGIAGILTFASFPKMNLGCLAWIALVPLALYVARCKGVLQAMLGGFLCGALQMGGLLVWVPAVMRNYGGVPWAGAWLLYALLIVLQALYPAAACALTRFCINRRGDGLLFVFPFVWLTLEYIETRFPFGGFPWLLTGYSQTEYPRLMQIADVTSVYGVSFMILCVNTSLAWLLLRGLSHGKGSLGPVAAAGLLVGVSLAYGHVSLGRWDGLTTGHSVAMFQQNISADDPETVMEWKFRDGYVEMADRLKPGSVELLILPESPSPLSFQHDGQYQDTIRKLACRFELGMVFNNIAYRESREGMQYLNSAFFLDRQGAERGRYDKIHLVPFGEYIPVKRIFFFVEAVTKDVSDFQPGADYVTVPIDGHPVSALICFEAVFPQIARKFVCRGAELLINLTNDSWYGDTSAPYQHLAMSRWRAVENRRYLLRANNSGISAIIEPSGRVQARSRLLREDICVGRFSFVAAQSFYSRHGDVFIFLCVIITGCMLVLCIVRAKSELAR